MQQPNSNSPVTSMATTSSNTAYNPSIMPAGQFNINPTFYSYHTQHNASYTDYNTMEDVAYSDHDWFQEQQNIPQNHPQQFVNGYAEATANGAHSPNGQTATLSDRPSNSTTPYTDATKCKRSGNHIKRPMNAFMVWSKEERRKICDRHPDMHNAAISKELGRKWRSLTEEERAPYVKIADQLRELHKLEFPLYKYCPRKRARRTDPGDQSAINSQQCEREPVVGDVESSSSVMNSNSIVPSTSTDVNDMHFPILSTPSPRNSSMAKRQKLVQKKTPKTSRQSNKRKATEKAALAVSLSLEGCASLAPVNPSASYLHAMARLQVDVLPSPAQQSGDSRQMTEIESLEAMVKKVPHSVQQQQAPIPQQQQQNLMVSPTQCQTATTVHPTYAARPTSTPTNAFNGMANFGTTISSNICAMGPQTPESSVYNDSGAGMTPYHFTQMSCIPQQSQPKHVMPSQPSVMILNNYSNHQHIHASPYLLQQQQSSLQQFYPYPFFHANQMSANPPYYPQQLQQDKYSIIGSQHPQQQQPQPMQNSPPNGSTVPENYGALPSSATVQFPTLHSVHTPSLDMDDSRSLSSTSSSGYASTSVDQDGSIPGAVPSASMVKRAICSPVANVAAAYHNGLHHSHPYPQARQFSYNATNSDASTMNCGYQIYQR